MGDSVRYEDVMRELTPQDRRRIRRLKFSLTLIYVQLVVVSIPLIALYKANSSKRDAQGFTPTQFESECSATLFGWFLGLASLLLVQLTVQATRLYSMQSSATDIFALALVDTFVLSTLFTFIYLKASAVVVEDKEGCRS